MKLGDYVRDEVTGFSGTVTAVAEYMDGTTQAQVQPVCNDAGEYPSSAWIDRARLVPAVKTAKNSGVGFKG